MSYYLLKLSTKDLSLDVGEDRIILESRKKGYVLDVFVPQLIEQENVEAKLNQKSGVIKNFTYQYYIHT